ncbi:5'-nucleotidase [Scopulibacillus darangshiensis]|uniref:5'-nucleotidase n=1 Tax=Scopulibacillus darangshiensis TaxID=442528 RepID=A0A4R2NE68_9BACL|nr:bifunctional metallophosphatase/5'-nucleotidase [Scopulibacillus darangshiensis]TCP19533.1 5'-nucleotidase [Scopulibacillus darangshiensis]
MGKKIGLSMLIALLLSFSPLVSHFTAQAKGNGGKDDIAFQMLAVNDFHGNLNTENELNTDGKSLKVGGAAYLATHLNLAEQDMSEKSKKKGIKSYSLRLHAGDLVGASPPISSLLQDEPTVKAFNAMHFKVGALGNHEFDEGIPELKRLLYATSVHPMVKKYTQGFDYNYKGIDSDFDYLAANVVDKKSGKPIFQPYTVKNIGGVKVGFIGVVTLETLTSAMPKYVKPYQFLDEAKVINKYTKELQSKGVHAIVVIGHVPAVTKDGKTTGRFADIAKKINDDVDIIFAGHNHEYANGFVDGKLIIEDRLYGEAFGDVRAKLDPNTQDFVKGSIKAKVVPNTRDVKPDPEIQKIVDQANEITDQVTKKPIGYAENGKPIGKKKPEDGENPLGNLITDGQRKMMGTDFAITNSGGIRDALKLKTNDQGQHVITWGAAYTVQPFQNQLGAYKLTGKDIKEGLNQQWQNPDHIMFLQFSGFKYTYVDGSKSPGCDQKYCVKDIYLPNGSKLEMDKTYTVGMNEFLANGGDAFTAFAKGKLVQPYKSDTDTFIDYIKKLNAEGKKIDPKIEGRATLVKPVKDDQNNGSNGAVHSDHTNTGHKLPNTATNIYNILLAGIVFIAAGLFTLVFRRKRV